MVVKNHEGGFIMEKSIENAADAVLAFLNGIPLSASTVKHYRSYYRTIGRYCQSNGFP